MNKNWIYRKYIVNYKQSLFLWKNSLVIRELLYVARMKIYTRLCVRHSCVDTYGFVNAYWFVGLRTKPDRFYIFISVCVRVWTKKIFESQWSREGNCKLRNSCNYNYIYMQLQIIQLYNISHVYKCSDAQEKKIYI